MKIDQQQNLMPERIFPPSHINDITNKTNTTNTNNSTVITTNNLLTNTLAKNLEDHL
jgi:hypothetical protein